MCLFDTAKENFEAKLEKERAKTNDLIKRILDE